MRTDQKDTTYIMNGGMVAETARLDTQAQEVNHVTGLFPKGLRDSLPADASVLDVGCGPGTWALDVAYQYPEMEVVGIDINTTLIEYARARARSQGRQNSCFEVIDAFDTGYAERSFDVVHVRFAAGWVPGASWPALLSHLHHLLDRGGWVICTEGEWPYTTSWALNQLNKLLSQAMHNAGMGLSADGSTQGVVARLGSLLYKVGFDQTQVECHALDFSGHHPREHKIWLDDSLALYRLVRPFLSKYVPRSEAMIDFLYDQMMRQMWEPDFCGVGSFYTCSAQKR
jgi:SAM-dependent methyltransferase